MTGKECWAYYSKGFDRTKGRKTEVHGHEISGYKSGPLAIVGGALTSLSTLQHHCKEVYDNSSNICAFWKAVLQGRGVGFQEKKWFKIVNSWHGAFFKQTSQVKKLKWKLKCILIKVLSPPMHADLLLNFNNIIILIFYVSFLKFVIMFK